MRLRSGDYGRGAHRGRWPEGKESGKERSANKRQHRHCRRQKGERLRRYARMGKRKKTVAARGKGIVDMPRELTLPLALGRHRLFPRQTEVTWHG